MVADGGDGAFSPGPPGSFGLDREVGRVAGVIGHAIGLVVGRSSDSQRVVEHGMVTILSQKRVAIGPVEAGKGDGLDDRKHADSLFIGAGANDLGDGLHAFRALTAGFREQDGGDDLLAVGRGVQLVCRRNREQEKYGK